MTYTVVDKRWINTEPIEYVWDGESTGSVTVIPYFSPGEKLTIYDNGTAREIEF